MSFTTKRSGQRVDISLQGQLYVEEATELREKLLPPKREGVKGEMAAKEA